MISRKLKANQPCPLHHGNRFCCGRSKNDRPIRKKGHGIWHQTGHAGVMAADDGREKCSPAVLRRRKDRLLQMGKKCEACGEGFSDYRDVELSHRVGKGMAGSTHNDAFSNLILLHTRANREQGSMDFETYRKEKWRLEHCL